LLCSRWRIFEVSEITSALIAHYDNRPFWIPACTNKDALECAIHLKVRLVDGTLDVRTLWLRCGFRIRPYA